MSVIQLTMGKEAVGPGEKVTCVVRVKDNDSIGSRRGKRKEKEKVAWWVTRK